MTASIERTSVEGKPATVAYFDANGQLTTKDKAVLVKVVFDDGRRLFLTPAEET